MRFLVVHELGGELGGEAVRAAECGFAAVGRPGGGGARRWGAEWRGTEPLEGAHIGRKV